MSALDRFEIWLEGDTPWPKNKLDAFMLHAAMWIGVSALVVLGLVMFFHFIRIMWGVG